MNYTLFKVKAGKRQVWLDWCHLLMTVHKEEAEETLVEEDLVSEMCVLFGEGDNTFLLYKHVPAEGKVKKPAVMERELNRKHFELIKECLQRITPRELGYDLGSKRSV